MALVLPGVFEIRISCFNDLKHYTMFSALTIEWNYITEKILNKYLIAIKRSNSIYEKAILSMTQTEGCGFFRFIFF